ncbi:hypothetical protein [Streptomyces sp. URMC 123]|uniref:hypothetical protein n=1 Tax=Streptomyces sp. URMC 123 TaxID=3423403 RepID=UPI003F19E4F7
MPKNQSTAAQTARKAARDGAKYTTALRAAREAQAAAGRADAPVVRFLAKGSWDACHLVAKIAAVWAREGQRVLLLQEHDPYWGMALRRRRRGKSDEPPSPPQPRTTTLWSSCSTPGTLVLHACLWKNRGSAQPGGRGGPQDDLSPLRAVLDDARRDYDVVVLLPHRGWSCPDREMATAHVALAEVDDFPHIDCLIVLPDTHEVQGAALSPEQSAAVLRERCLSFLFGYSSLPIPLAGVIWQVNGKLPVDEGFLAGVDRDMERAGLRPLGWTIREGWRTGLQRLPEAGEFQDPAFTEPYQQVAVRLRASLGGG